MSKDKISEYDATAGNNTDVAGVSIAEGTAPSNINNAIRALMAHLKDMDAGTQALTSPALTSATITNATLGGLTYPTSDGTANQVLATSGSGALSFIDGNTTTINPTGSVIAFAGSSAPAGYLICDGSAVSRSTYSALFGVVASTYGGGDGSSTFNVPNLSGRVIAGKESSASNLTSAVGGVDGATLGATGGAQGITLTSAQSGVPAHTHGLTMDAHTHTFTGTPHNHGGIVIPVSPPWIGGGASGGYSSIANQFTANATAGGTNSTVTTTGTIANNSTANASSAHANVQPTVILNYIIKT